MIEAYGSHVPMIDPSAWVHDSAVIQGEVVLGPRVSVWPTAVLRGDMGLIEVGEDSNIQDGAICHNTDGLSVTRVGRKVTVGHRAVLHGCVVEDRCLIGMGAVILDNAVIGTGSIVGAGAVVAAGRVIPPGSLVLGLPARVVRPLEPNEAARIDEGWQSYLKKIEERRSMG